MIGRDIERPLFMMVFVPTWEIIYDDEKSASQGYDCNALFNAIDGTLIEASFR